MLVYRDDNHLTSTYVSFLQPVLDDALQAVLAGVDLPAPS
jgi:hypothetical protein